MVLNNADTTGQEQTQLAHATTRISELEAELALLKRTLTPSGEELTSVHAARNDARYRSLVTNSPDLIYILDLDYHIQFASSTTDDFTLQQILGANALDFIAQDDVPPFKATLDAARDEGRLGSIEVRVPTPDDVLWYEARIRPIQEGGRTVELLLISGDITRRKRAEAALTASEARLRELITSVPGTLYQFTAGPQGWTMHFITESIMDLAGVQAEDILRDIGVLHARHHPDDVQRFVSSVNAVVERPALWVYEGRFVKPSGEVRWFQGRSNPVALPDGSMVFNGVLIDITDRKQAQEAQERLVQILESTSDFVGTATMDGVTQYINAAGQRMVGLKAGDDITSRRISDFSPPWALEIIGNRGIPTAIQDGVWEGESALLNGQGEEFPVSQVIICHKDARGVPVFLSTIARDITDRKQAEKEREQLLKREKAALREAQDAVRLKDLFLATMSHELRTPLNAIIGFQHLMMFSGQMDDDNVHMAERSIANSQRLLSLINNILDISRMASGGLKIVPVSFSPKALAKALHDDLRFQAAEKGLTLTVDIDETLPETIIHDEERIGQVVLNLVGNAIKFTEKGSIELSLGAQGERLIIRVHDTGIGIPLSRQHVIFDDFVQLDNTSTRKHQGAGLGLSIVKRLVLLMKGSVEVTSEVGKGSTFTVDLPLALDPALFQ
jgi:PAS domain S-box-containing protein